VTLVTQVSTSPVLEPNAVLPPPPPNAPAMPPPRPFLNQHQQDQKMQTIRKNVVM
jgi:hypothetical protein